MGGRQRREARWLVVGGLGRLGGYPGAGRLTASSPMGSERYPAISPTLATTSAADQRA